jgi:hypothetical protein
MSLIKSLLKILMVNVSQEIVKPMKQAFATTVKGGQTMIELLARLCVGLALFVVLVITTTIICNKERRGKNEGNSVNE